MKNTKRFTISGRNLQFLEDLSREMDESNLNAVINYLLTDVRLLNYQIGSKPAPNRQQTPIGYSFDTSTFEVATPIQECDRNYREPDPIISRLASLIEEF